MKRSTTDKLSELPEEVLNRILCFLPQKESLRTCLLSKSWRHLGSTRSKLEFSLSDDFNGNIKKLTSVVYNTLQRYNLQNLPVHQLVLKMNNFDLPTIPFELEFLHELYLRDLRLLNVPNEDNLNLLLKRLRKLTLETVDISNEYLGTILSRCSTLEYLGISNDRKGLTSVSKTDARNLKHFVWSHDHHIWYDSAVEIDVPTLETIRIVRCPTWRLHEDVYFPRLKSVYLKWVQLNYESFGFFSSNYMPSLEELQLHLCYGCREFHLSSLSIKRLHLIYDTIPLIKATIDAPNIVYFKLDVLPLQSISFTPTLSDQWKSILHLSVFVFGHNAALPRMLKLNEVLKALNRSQITLKVYLDFGCHDHQIEDSTFGGLYNNKPLDVEHLNVELPKYQRHSSVPFIFNYLFRVCRPRYIDADSLSRTSNDLTVILTRLLLHERDRSDYFWNQDLVEVSIQTYCRATKEWCPVDGNSLSESAMPDNRQIRFGLKWREH